jgi:hypothetical protein
MAITEGVYTTPRHHRFSTLSPHANNPTHLFLSYESQRHLCHCPFSSFLIMRTMTGDNGRICTGRMRVRPVCGRNSSSAKSSTHYKERNVTLPNFTLRGTEYISCTYRHHGSRTNYRAKCNTSVQNNLNA